MKKQTHPEASPAPAGAAVPVETSAPRKFTHITRRGGSVVITPAPAAVQADAVATVTDQPTEDCNHVEKP